MSGRRNERKKKKGQVKCKVVMVGDASVGKTCLVHRYTERQYQDSISTIGASFILKTWGTQDIAIWDTAGEEKYAGMTTFYYRNASAAILTFDMFDRTSFYNLKQRYIPILDDVASAKLKVIVATKSDLLDKCIRKVTRDEGIELAKKSNPHIDCSTEFIPYFETSSKTGHNVDEMFEYIFLYFYPLGETNSRSFSVECDSVILDNEVEKHTSKCCS